MRLTMRYAEHDLNLLDEIHRWMATRRFSGLGLSYLFLHRLRHDIEFCTSLLEFDTTDPLPDFIRFESLATVHQEAWAFWQEEHAIARKPDVW